MRGLEFGLESTLRAAERCHRESQQLLKSTLEDQLHENGALREQLEVKCQECGELTLRSQQLSRPKWLTSFKEKKGGERVPRSSELSELRGLRAMLPQVKAVGGCGWSLELLRMSWRRANAVRCSSRSSWRACWRSCLALRGFM